MIRTSEVKGKNASVDSFPGRLSQSIILCDRHAVGHTVPPRSSVHVSEPKTHNFFGNSHAETQATSELYLIFAHHNTWGSIET